MPGRGLLVLIVCLALGLPRVWAGNRFTVNESTCSFVDAINYVNLGLVAGCFGDVEPTSDPLSPDEIVFASDVTEIELITVMGIYKSVKIMGPSTKVSFIRQLGHSALLFHLDGTSTPGMLVAFENCVFTQASPTTVVNSKVGGLPVTGHIGASLLEQLDLVSCDFDGSVVRDDSFGDPAAVVGCVSCVQVNTFNIISCTMTNSNVQTSQAIGSFGAILCTDSVAVDIQLSEFSLNFSNGGESVSAVTISADASVDVSSSTFSGNSGRALAIRRGGGDDPLLAVSLADCLFTRNTSGGGLAVTGAQSFIFECNAAVQCGFVDNAAPMDDEGGAIFLLDVGSANMAAADSSIAEFTNNVAGSGGAVLSAGIVTLAGPWQVTGNRATASDGGAFRVGEFGSVGPLVLEDNFAFGNGGAVFATQGILITRAERFVNNVAAGGGVACSQSGAVNVSVVGPVEFNSGNVGGGGVILTLSNSLASLSVIGSISSPIDIHENSATAPGLGGGLIDSAGEASLSVCPACAGVDIFDNEAGFFGALVSAVSDVTIQLGDNVNVFDNTLLSSMGLGGAFYSGRSITLDGGGNFSNNGLNCESGGSLFAESDVTITGDAITFRDHSVTAGGGAVWAGESITATLRGVNNNSSPGHNGGAFLAGTTILIDSIEFITSNRADAGGAFFADTVTISSVTGTVSGNSVFSADDQGCVLWGNADTVDSFTATGTASLVNNQGTIAHSEGDLNVSLAESTLVSENNGLFSAQREIVIEASGAQFVGNDPNDNSYMVHSFSSDVSLTQPGDISMNNFGSAFLSGAGTVRLNELAGNVTANSGTSFMRGNNVMFSSEGGSRSIKDNTSVQFFVGTESVIATARDGAIVDLIDNDCVLFFANGAECTIEYELGAESTCSGNRVPIVSASSTGATVTVVVGEIVASRNGGFNGGIIHVNAADPSIVLEATHGICANLEPGSGLGNAFLVSTVGNLPMTNAFIAVSTPEGSIESNVGTVPLLAPFNSGTAEVSTILYGDSQVPLDPSITATVSLEEPTSLTPAAPSVSVLAGVNFDVVVELDVFVTGHVQVSVSTDSSAHTLNGDLTEVATSSQVSFTDLSVLGPDGTIDLMFSVDGVCTPITASLQVQIGVVVVPTPEVTPIVTPETSPTIVFSGTPAPPTTGVATGTVTPPVTATRTPVGPPVTATRTPVGTFSSPTPAGPAPAPTVAPFPSLQSSFSVAPAISQSRSPSRSGAPTVAPTCLGNCIVTGGTPVDEEVEIIDVNREPVGTVLLPGTSVDPGETVIVGPGSPEAEAAARQLDLGSAVVQITIVDSYGQSAQPTGNIEVCLHVPDTEKAADDGCLSFFDEERQEWICEDPCLKIEGSTVCGTVNHLTNFAVLFTGGGGGSGCGEDDDDGALIFDAAWKDGIFVASFFVAAVVICLVVGVIVLLFPGLASRLHGAEYRRIKSLRSSSSKLGTSDAYDQSATVI